MTIFRNLFLLFAVCGTAVYTIPIGSTEETTTAAAEQYDEAHARAFLDVFLKALQKEKTKNVIANWAYASNITDHNLQVQNQIATEGANFTKVRKR